MSREGFQSIPGLGAVPKAWAIVSADAVSVKISKGTTPPKSDVSERGEIPFLRVNNLSFSGVLDQNSAYLYVNRDAHENFLSRSRAFPGDVLMNIVGPPLGKISLLDDKYEEYNMNQAVVFYRLDISRIAPEYFLAFLRTHNAQYWLQSRSKKTSGQQNLTIELCKQLPVPMPPLPEQKKIAQILSTWDKAIATTEKLLANSQQQKKALMQQLLTGKKRLLDKDGVRFSGEWEHTAISRFIVESRVGGSTGLVAKKLTVKLYGNGVHAKDEKRLGSESTKYYVRESGQFIYSKLDFLNGAFGIVPRELDGFESTLDLPAFDFLDGVSPTWFMFYISRKEFYLANLGLANGGRKARRVNPDDLLKVKILCPPHEEQIAIASAIDVAVSTTDNLLAKVGKLKKEKKALMQQLLTGKRRVKTD
jgi:type I restriction enzyme S subunit